MNFEPGDRVRVTTPQSAYTGCRGEVVEVSGEDGEDVSPLGYYVAIDGENGVSRPFLAGDLAPLVAAKVRRRDVAARARG
jgi:hypothetical protein